MIAKTSCQNCGASIEFEAEQSGQFTACPHCGQQTELRCAAKPPPPPPGKATLSRAKLHPCRCCERPISKEARRCPHCGQGTGKSFASRLVVCFVGMALIASSLSAESSTIYQQIYHQIGFVGGIITVALSAVIETLDS